LFGFFGDVGEVISNEIIKQYGKGNNL
jgi:hypothetical protein